MNSDNNPACYYAVDTGERPGVYDSYPAAKKAMGSVPGAFCKKYPTKEEAALAISVGINRYTRFRASLPMPPDELDHIYVIAEPKSKASVFAYKADFEETVENLQAQGYKVKSMVFGPHQLDAALMFFAKGERQYDQEHLKQYEWVNQIFRRGPLSPSDEMMDKWDAVADAALANMPGRRLQLTKHPTPRRMKGKTGDTKEDSVEAKKIRDDLRSFLELFDAGASKFDAESNNDGFVGNYTEHFVQDYILANYAYAGVEAYRYGDLFNETKVWDIIDKHSVKNPDGTRSVRPGTSLSEEDLAYVSSYFYDKYDILMMRGNQQVTLDVKGAATDKQARERWDFLYPEKQAKSYRKAKAAGLPTKEYAVIAFCQTEKGAGKDTSRTEDALLWGVCDMDIIAEAPLVKKGERTFHGTKSETLNRVITLDQCTKFADFIEQFILDTEPPEKKAKIVEHLYAGDSFKSAYLAEHSHEGIPIMSRHVKMARIAYEGLEKIVRAHATPFVKRVQDAARVGNLESLNTAEMDAPRKPHGLAGLISEAEHAPNTKRGNTDVSRDDDAR